MNSLSLFGLIAVSLMLVFYSLERRSRWYTLAFAGACALGSVYGFLQGALAFWICRGHMVLRRRPALVAGRRISWAERCAISSPTELPIE